MEEGREVGVAWSEAGGTENGISAEDGWEMNSHGIRTTRFAKSSVSHFWDKMYMVRPPNLRLLVRTITARTERDRPTSRQAGHADNFHYDRRYVISRSNEFCAC